MQLFTSGEVTPGESTGVMVKDEQNSELLHEHNQQVVTQNEEVILLYSCWTASAWIIYYKVIFYVSTVWQVQCIELFYIIF